MIPYLQTKLTTDSQKGNCFETCLISLLNLPESELPDFHNTTDWQIDFLKWLKQHGYYSDGVSTDFNELQTYSGIDGYVIVCGKSPRQEVVSGHSVLYLNGKFIHDPHPSGLGLLEEQFWLYIDKKE